MHYLCEKQLFAGGVTYHVGEIIPDGVILSQRSGKLMKSGYISELNLEMPEGSSSRQSRVFTKEEVDAMIAEAVEEAEKKSAEQLAGMQDHVEMLDAAALSVLEETVPIPIKGGPDGDNGQQMAVPASPEEIQQVFSVMQLNAEDGARAIADVESENVLILLHAADSRKTVKNAAKERADKLFSTETVPNESTGGNATTGTNTEGADT